MKRKLKKYLKNLFFPIIFLFCFTNLVFAVGAVSFTEDVIVSLSGISDGLLSVASGSQATSVDVTGAVLTVSAIPAGDSFTLETPTSANALKLTPSGGTLDLTFNSVNLSSGNITEWTLTATGATTVAHIVGVPLANTWYNIKIGGVILNSYQSSAGGEVSFTYSGGWSTKVFTIEPDTTPPATSFSLTAPANNAYVSVRQPTFSWNASTDPDISYYKLYIDGNLNRNNITGVSTTPVADLSCANHTWYIKAVDNANNSTDSATFNFSIRCKSIVSSITTLPSSITPPISEVNPLINYIDPLKAVPDTLTLFSAKFTSNLKKGMRNTSVKRLQQLLATDKKIYPEGLITGYFGPATQKAIQRFQLKYKIVKSKKDSGYGIVGPKTRAKLLEVFGK